MFQLEVQSHNWLRQYLKMAFFVDADVRYLCGLAQNFVLVNISYMCITDTKFINHLSHPSQILVHANCALTKTA